MKMPVELLYPMVSEAIRRAEILEELKAPGARGAFADLSLLEERIAEILPAADPERGLAIRGAVRAALSAGDFNRALDLAGRFLAEGEAEPSSRDELLALSEAAAFALHEQRLERHFEARFGRLTEVAPQLPAEAEPSFRGELLAPSESSDNGLRERAIEFYQAVHRRRQMEVSPQLALEALSNVAAHLQALDRLEVVAGHSTGLFNRMAAAILELRHSLSELDSLTDPSGWQDFTRVFCSFYERIARIPQRTEPEATRTSAAALPASRPTEALKLDHGLLHLATAASTHLQSLPELRGVVDRASTLVGFSLRRVETLVSELEKSLFSMRLRIFHSPAPTSASSTTDVPRINKQYTPNATPKPTNQL